MLRFYLLFLLLLISAFAQANSTQPLPSLTSLEKVGIQLVKATHAGIPQGLGIFISSALASYYTSSKITKNPFLRALATLTTAAMACAAHDHYAIGRGRFIPAMFCHDAPERLALNWDEVYQKMDPKEKNALLELSYPEFIKLFGQGFYLDKAEKMNSFQQKWRMLEVKEAVLHRLQCSN